MRATTDVAGWHSATRTVGRITAALVAVVCVCGSAAAAAEPAMSAAGTPGIAEIPASAALASYWLFAYGDGVYLGEYERESTGRAALTIERLYAAAAPRTVRRIPSEGSLVRAIDAIVLGADLVMVLEINRGHALQLAKVPVAVLTDAAAPPPSLTPMQYLELDPAQQALVRVPAAEQWNVADYLAPAQWLFSPRLVRGLDHAEVVANAADGHGVQLPVDRPGPRAVIADEPVPQSAQAGQLRSGAFLRFATPYRPFWSLARYSGPKQAERGTLWATLAASQPVSLSAQCGLGPVSGFALATDGNAQPWIFALEASPAGTRLAALAQRSGQWDREYDLAVDGSPEQVAALYSQGSWYIVTAVRVAGGWSLRLLLHP
jgi:hypothetical protein